MSSGRAGTEELHLFCGEEHRSDESSLTNIFRL
jgi:hypothetical protein